MLILNPSGQLFRIFHLKGFHIDGNGDMVNVQTRRNETNIHIRGGSVIFKQDCLHTVAQSAQTFIDIIVALNVTDNFTAKGDLFIDDSTRKSKQCLCHTCIFL